MDDKFGSVYRDKITGFEGVVTGKASYITGCDQYLLSPPVKDGSYQEGRYFDSGRIELVSKKLDASDVAAEKNGCDMRAPVK